MNSTRNFLQDVSSQAKNGALYISGHVLVFYSHIYMMLADFGAKQRVHYLPLWRRAHSKRVFAIFTMAFFAAT